MAGQTWRERVSLMLATIGKGYFCSLQGGAVSLTDPG
jgi:hypothetical protein